FEGVVHAVNVSARRVTGVVQTGSLPVYVAVILLVTAGVPAFLFGTGVPWPGWPDAFDVPLQIPLAAVVVGAAAMAAAVRRRIAAAVLLGVVGYGVALLFVVQGAPDLALTQFAVETLLTVAFVLVLRFLPGHFERRRPAVGLPMRVAIATTVAAGTFFFALVAAGHRTAPPVGPQITDIALPEGHGRNVVNVVLVDVRALDTFGEISVLVVAALGVVALARVGRRGAEAVPPPPLLAPGGSPERAGEGRA
ncbi:MAG TPA: hydrogen gas-evolving membrane-bound hydrogenase subunit E, partial [Acidimicrobiia bacterium]|nr:hydrogen gas-evolving membrane-bound hydrogenase subunit E [Acidimicrobiia bacterium]